MLQAGVKQRMEIGVDRNRKAPVAIRDGVEDWARIRGGHGDVVWVAEPANLWQVELTLKGDDPRLQVEGPGGDFKECVQLHVWWTEAEWLKNKPDEARKRRQRWIAMPGKRAARDRPGFYAYTLEELGLNGILKILNKGCLLSGRGQYNSAEEHQTELAASNKKLQDTRRADAQDRVQQKAKHVRRRVLKIPMTRVGISWPSMKKFNRSDK